MLSCLRRCIPTVLRSRVGRALPSQKRVFQSLSRAAAVAAFLGLGVAAAHATATTYTVNSTADTAGSSTTVTLPYAIIQADLNPGSTIKFSPTLDGDTITLASSLPPILFDMTIQGPGANKLTISGAGKYGIFYVATTSGNVGISGLTISDGAGFALPTFSGTFGGGLAIFMNPNDVYVDSCIFSGNSATYGGAIYATALASKYGGFQVANTTFLNNSAGTGGAINGIPNNNSNDTSNTGVSGPIYVVDSTFIGNSAREVGGAVTNAANATTIRDSTFYGNTAGIGAAAANFGTLILDNNIIANNSSTNSAQAIGAAIYNFSSSGGTTNADSNVYWHNLASDGSELDCANCNSNTNAVSAPSNPLALPLAYYGGTTETLLPQPGSAAICAADPAEATDVIFPLTSDQRGFPLKSSNCQNGNVDAGADQTAYQTVTNTSDSGADSLRAAINAANTAGYGDIDFDPSLDGKTITLSSATLSITGGKGTNIIGPGANQLTVSGNNSATVDHVFTVNSGAMATLYGLTITQGNAGEGGGVKNAGMLTLADSAVSGNTAFGGGGIYSSGTMAILDTTVSNNSAGILGGGIENFGGTLTMTESTVSGNSTPPSLSMGGGGIYNSGAMTITNSTIAGNAQNDASNSGIGGGGIWNQGAMTLDNSIAAGNTDAVTFHPSANILGPYSGSGNVVGGSTNSTTSLVNGTGAAITLSPLQLNGIGATLETQIPLPGSAAICAGKTSNIPFDITTDERGYPLTTPGYCSSGQIDAGAVQTNYTGVQFVQQPTSTRVNTAITPAPSVEVLETDTLLSSNNTDAVAGIPITLDYSGGASELSGTPVLTQTTAGSNAVATFSGLTPNTVGSGFTLAVNNAASGGLPVVNGTTLTATSNSFYVYGAAASLGVSATTPINAGQSTSVQVTALDKNGNTVLNDDDTLSLTATNLSTNQSSSAGTLTLKNGTGTANITLTAGGTYTLTAKDTTTGLTGVSNTITVNKLATKTTLSVSNGSITPGQSVKLTATVTASVGTPAGTVDFYDGSTSLGSATLSNGVATLSTTALSAGVTNSLTATYEGNATYLSSTTTTPVSVVVAPLDFTISLSGASIATIVPGKTATFSVTVDPLYGSYAGPVSFNVTGLPPGATYTVSPSTVAANAGKQTVTLTIQTAATTASMHKPQPLGRRIAPIGLALLLLPFFGTGSMRRYSRRFRRLLCVLLVVGGLGATIGLSGCGSNSGFFAQQAKSYNVTVTATAGSLTHTTTVTLDVE